MKRRLVKTLFSFLEGSAKKLSAWKTSWMLPACVSLVVLGSAWGEEVSTGQSYPTSYYVAIDGDDGYPGTIDRPFRSIARAVEVLKAGDTCYLREGRYHEAVVARGLEGTADHPITITAYEDETVVLDGSRSLEEMGSSGWRPYRDGIFQTTLREDIWQLYVNGELMIPARWPNANFDDGSIWEFERWGRGDAKASANGLMVDAPHGEIDLAATGLDVTGAMAVLNVGSWKTWTREVTQHQAGSNRFTYEPATTYLPKDHHYFLEAHLSLLDAEKEWYFDAPNQTVYLKLPGGAPPVGSVRGKVQNYAIDVSDSQYVQLVGLEFFGTTFRFRHSRNITVRDCDLLYPSCSQRMLGRTDPPLATTLEQADAAVISNSSIINCTFRFAASHAVYMNGRGDRIENCLFEYTDWSPSELPFLMGSVLMLGEDSVFRRNTSRYSGASEFLDVGKRALVELNDVSHYGLLQGDGAMVQVTIPAQPECVIRRNWFHDSPQLGARFDAPIPPVRWGRGGMIVGNVGWNLRSMVMIKGEQHRAIGNTALGGANNGMIILDDSGVNGGANAGTITRNNAADKLSGHRSKRGEIPGLADSNWNGYDYGTALQDELRDPDQLDFRPRPGSILIDAGVTITGQTEGFIGDAPDLGAYEAGAEGYWIPGRMLPLASRPIPEDGAEDQSLDRDLIFLPGYDADSARIYFGDDPATLELIAERPDPERNVLVAGKDFVLREDTTFFWRVDSVLADGTSVPGETWSFRTGAFPTRRRAEH